MEAPEVTNQAGSVSSVDARALDSLSIRDTQQLLRHYNLPQFVLDAFYHGNVDGSLLDCVEVVDDFKDIKVHGMYAKRILKIVQRAKQEGVPFNWLSETEHSSTSSDIRSEEQIPVVNTVGSAGRSVNDSNAHVVQSPSVEAASTDESASKTETRGPIESCRAASKGKTSVKNMFGLLSFGRRDSPAVDAKDQTLPRSRTLGPASRAGDVAIADGADAAIVEHAAPGVSQLRGPVEVPPGDVDLNLCRVAYDHFHRAAHVNTRASALWLEQASVAGNIPAKLYLMVFLCRSNDNAERVRIMAIKIKRDILPPLLLSSEITVRALAEFISGFCCYSGLGCDVDKAQAVTWWLKAATNGHEEAQYCLARCYQSGNGVAINLDKEIEWWRKAASQGHTGAQYWLGYRLCSGSGAHVNRDQGIVWYRKAAAQGHGGSQLALKYMNASL